MFTKIFRYIKFSSFLAAFPTFQISNSLILSYGYYSTLNQYSNNLHMLQPINNQIQVKNIQLGIFERMKNILKRIIRFGELILIFSPALILLPLKFFESTQQYWLMVFVKCIEWGGVVWIKSFQYLSHRRDIIGEKMANRFIHLREKAPLHKFQETNKSIKMQFGKNIDQIFEQFDQTPIASGSISQVYKAVYNGQKVAVKVKHPGLEKNIECDIDILFFISRSLSYISQMFEIPVNSDSLKKTLTDQLDFIIQANNLKTFNDMFKNNNRVNFPNPNEDTKSSILIQNFIDGVPITHYQLNRHKLNKVIARIGAMTFFQMLIKMNFIHADCHGGNIIVRIKDHKWTVLDKIKDSIRLVYRFFQNKFISISNRSNIQKQLYMQYKQEEDEIKKMQRQSGQRVQITLIDVGIVLRLEQIDKINFSKFIQSLITKNPEESAKMIYSLSFYGGKKIILQNTKVYQSYYQDLKKLFQKIAVDKIKDIQGIVVLKGMLDVIRSYRMKLDGQFATLLTNMLILQQIAKDLNPDINILMCAVPYFKDITLQK